ncbi:uncharacterized protein LOC125653906 [Ostrea edulis]|uniref:uncharacterized protein LOC125653906 n=1 Tax=Ostrea edulis TaxID=37623 RepID=UPI002095B7E4|nr:uncharacterized protein LOC125653906 [Ostrea edulis]
MPQYLPVLFPLVNTHDRRLPAEDSLPTISMETHYIPHVLAVLSCLLLKVSTMLEAETAFDLYVQKLCRRNSSLILPHPLECQLYYDCSTKYNTLPPNLNQHMRECPFPDLFSVQTLRCEDYRHVTCAGRAEHKTACEYRLNQLNVYHVMCTLQDVESGGIGQEAVSPGIMGLLENSAIGKHDLKSNNLIKPKELTNSRISLDALKKDLCSNKTP